MAGNNYNVTGDNLPKDSGNRYMQALYDPANNAFTLMLGYPVSGSAGGLAQGHVINHVIDTFSATSFLSSGVDLGGYTTRGLIIPICTPANLSFQVSASGQGWASIATPATVIYSATGVAGGNYALDQTIIQYLIPFRWVRISASQQQTAARNFTWSVAS